MSPSVAASSATTERNGLDGRSSTITAPEQQREPLFFNKILLSENTGIGFGGLKALWSLGAGCGGGGRVRGTSTTSVFRSLVRLELSRCGLTAADLAGLAPPSAHVATEEHEDVENGEGSFVNPGDAFGAGGNISSRYGDVAVTKGGGNSEQGGGGSAFPLRQLVLQDNPLTRVGVGARGRATGEGKNPLELAERGVTALRDLIASAPALELFDVSGECFVFIADPTVRAIVGFFFDVKTIAPQVCVGRKLVDLSRTVL